MDSSLVNMYGDCPWRVFARTHEEGRNVWRDIILHLYGAIEEEGALLTPKDAHIFTMIALGYESIKYKKQLEELAQKILIITGGADDIFPTSLLLNLGPETGLALLQIPGMSHWISMDHVHHSRDGRGCLST